MSASPKTARLDLLLCDRGLYSSRARARDAILRGGVKVNGANASRPGAEYALDATIELDDAARHYVSRAALKLIAGLDHFAINPHGTIALDIGASTGGFTQVLLERGAARVHAVDVGHDQLHADLRADARVLSQEGLNARDLTLDHLQGDAPQIIVCDASFISLTLVLPQALALAAPGARGVFLVKPQFEAGRDAIGKGGILKDAMLGPQIAVHLADWLDSQADWQCLGFTPSPISGGDGNHEFLLGGFKSAGAAHR
jgi:23S rRNA (cytidine1920-2'-O)/16S rRNA (cytidine1409-2'-O)-methyltransferase